jgi:integrase
MPSFRSPKAQAAHAVGKKLAIGKSRHDNKESGLVHSIGTARNHRQALAGFAAFLNEYRLGDLRTATTTDALAYLAVRSTEVRQSALDLDRQAIQVHLGQQLERIKSDLVTERGARAYSPEQLAAIREHLTPRNSLAVELCEQAGLRAHEIASLRPLSEQPRSTHRPWRPDLYNNKEGAWYSVRGKGGLVRAVVLEPSLAARVEQTRCMPVIRIDRGCRTEQHYNLGSGQALSQAFTRASVKALGFSTGLHGARHTFCQRELERLQASGYSRTDAKELVSQSVGHFRSDIVDIYLR